MQLLEAWYPHTCTWRKRNLTPAVSWLLLEFGAASPKLASTLNNHYVTGVAQDQVSEIMASLHKEDLQFYVDFSLTLVLSTEHALKRS